MSSGARPAAARTRADARPSVGAAGERAAADHLARQGWTLVERNARTRYGEIDIVAREAATLVFVEVKARRGHAPGLAERALESIGPRKRLQIRRLARAWLADGRRRGGFAEIRFDAIGVSVDAAGRATAVHHVRAAF